MNRKIEGDSVRRVIDQILSSYLLSCMAFSVYEVVRVTNACRKVGLFMFLRPGGINKVTTRQTSHANDFVDKNTKSHAREKPLLAGYRRRFSSFFHWICHL